MELYSVGHSNRPLDAFLALLEERGVRTLADVRTLPKSKFVPHFNEATLAPALSARGIAYVHLKELGGLRKAAEESRNLGWRQKGLRGYADYMATAAFRDGRDRLLSLAEAAGPLAFMCAESDPRKCHRQLLADDLTAQGHRVLHILGPGEPSVHKLHPLARLRGGGVLEYPQPEEGEYPAQEEMW